MQGNMFRHEKRVLLGLLALAGGVVADDWNHGDPLAIMVSQKALPCPDKMPEATKIEDGFVRLAVSDDGSKLAFQTHEGQQNLFALSNGFNTVGEQSDEDKKKNGLAFGKNVLTNIQVIINGTAGGKCVHQVNHKLEMHKCSWLWTAQRFSVTGCKKDNGGCLATPLQSLALPVAGTDGKTPDTTKPWTVHVAQDGSLATDEQGQNTNTNTTQFCYYRADADSEPKKYPLLSPGKKYLIPQAQTQLGLVPVPDPANLTAVTELAGCKSSFGNAAKYDSFDCLVAKTYNGMPKTCMAKPNATECVLHNLAAFCGDLVDIRKAAQDEIASDKVGDALEKCARNVARGPFLANPSGAASASGLFANLRYARVPVPGKDQKAADSPKDMFPERNQTTTDASLDKFYVSYAKSLFTDVNRTTAAMQETVAERHALLCYGLSLTLNSTGIAQTCLNIFKPHQVERVMKAWYVRVLKAVETATLLVNATMDVADATAAGTLVNLQTWDLIAASFKPNQTADGKGVVLYGQTQAQHAQPLKMMMVDRKKPVPFASEGQAVGLLDYARQTGFRSCNVTLSNETLATADADADAKAQSQRAKRSRIAAREPPATAILFNTQTAVGLPMLQLDCVFGAWSPIESTDKNATNTTVTTGTGTGTDTTAQAPAALPAAPKRLTTLPNGQPDEKDLAKKLHDAFVALLDDKKETPGVTNVVGKQVANATTPQMKAELSFDMAKKYKMNKAEVGALQLWSDERQISNPDVLGAAFDKLPNYDGLVMRRTHLTPEQVEALTKFAAPGRTANQPWQVSDVVDNWQTTNEQQPTEPSSFLMATTPGLTVADFSAPVNYTFVIQARFGKWITPLSGGRQEVDFIVGSQGKYKLLGHAAADEHSEPTVFFFENVPS